MCERGLKKSPALPTKDGSKRGPGKDVNLLLLRHKREWSHSLLYVIIGRQVDR